MFKKLFIFLFRLKKDEAKFLFFFRSFKVIIGQYFMIYRSLPFSESNGKGNQILLRILAGRRPALLWAPKTMGLFLSLRLSLHRMRLNFPRVRERRGLITVTSAVNEI
jgi:hypothetical protein